MQPLEVPALKPDLSSRLVDRSPVPYAYVVLLVAFVTTMMTVPGQTLGVSVFLDSIIEDLDVTRSTVSLLYTAGTLVGSFVLPWVGRFIDARGPRLAVGLIAAAFSVATVYMSLVNGLWMLAIGFVLIRGLGQGSLSLVSLHVVNLWFVRRRGLAVGVTGLGMAFATVVFPGFIETLIAGFGWRGAYAWLGVMVAVLALPLGVTFFRDQPERYGALPDGRREAVADAPSAGTAYEAVPERHVTLAEARRTRAFWTIVAGDAAVAAFSTGLVFHHYDLMAQSGLTRVEAATVFVPLGLITAFALLTGGALMDRVRPRFMLAAMLVLQAAALLMAGAVPLWLAPFYGAAIGLTQGMKGAISGAIYATYFGRRYLGAIRGTASTIGVAGTAVGPLVFAVALDASGSYWPALIGTAVVSGLLAAASLTLKPPVESEPGEGPLGAA